MQIIITYIASRSFYMSKVVTSFSEPVQYRILTVKWRVMVGARCSLSNSEPLIFGGGPNICVI